MEPTCIIINITIIVINNFAAVASIVVKCKLDAARRCLSRDIQFP